jgi:FkbH-like protein
MAIAATFRADPIERHLRFWLKNLRITSDIKFAPYNQIFQELLTPGSILMRNQIGFNVLLLRFEDWEDRSNNGIDTGALQMKIDQLKELLKEAGEKSVAPFLVQICPVSPRFMDRLGGTRVFAEIEKYASSELGRLANVRAITASQLMDLYPVEDYYDKYCDENGQMPFTPALLASLGAMTARILYSFTRAPRKVIVLDCDGTLWGGVCGEDGPQDVQIDEHRQYLQDFMIQQACAGMLLCLCSKNNEPDVWQVFQSRSEMKLSRDHLVAWRINWQAKSENLKSLAQELNLGLDSFVFIDDAAAECHEVELKCPEVITIHIPGESERLPKFLKHLWVLDHWKTTEEDRQRLTLYKEHQIREKIRSEKPTLDSFIQSLNLELDIQLASEDQFDRISQLTLRTNQFNLTMRRRSAAEIQNLVRSGYRILTVTAKDRFGDYGIVGVMILLHKSNAFMVDTFLLSCRALGRNIEITMFERIVQLAREHGAVAIDVEYVQGERNGLALAFLDRMNPLSKSVNGLIRNFQFSTVAKEHQCTGSPVCENTSATLISPQPNPEF